VDPPLPRCVFGGAGRNARLDAERTPPVSSASESETPTPPLWKKDQVTALLREKADIYEMHPNYGWLLPGDGVGDLMAFELRNVANLIDWLAERSAHE